MPLRLPRPRYKPASRFQAFDIGGNLAAPRSASDALALEGIAADGKLKSFEAIGDFDGDGVVDYLATGANESYLLYGPILSNSLNRVAVDEFNGNNASADLRVRFEDGSFIVGMASPSDLANNAKFYRVFGRADVVIPHSVYGKPIALNANVIGSSAANTAPDTAADLAFVSLDTKFKVRLLAGSKVFPKLFTDAGQVTKLIELPTTFATSVDQITVSAADFSGDKKQDIIVTTSRPTAPTTSSIIGYVFTDTTPAVNVTETAAKFVINNDMGSRATAITSLGLNVLQPDRYRLISR